MLTLMDRLVPAAVIPVDTGSAQRRQAVARFMLYVRAHWLRMPLPLLSRHLLRKAVFSRRAG